MRTYTKQSILYIKHGMPPAPAHQRVMGPAAAKRTRNLSFYHIRMTIAVDFDGTIVEHRYPSIGKEIPFAIETLKKLQDQRHRLILWTVREGRLLDEAVAFCRQRGLEFYAVNHDYPEEEAERNGHYSRKLKADLFIDDRNLGGLPDWGVIYRMVTEKMSYADLLRADAASRRPAKRGFLSRLFG